mgnify:CR=1 FL=1
MSKATLSAADLRLSHTYIESLDWATCIVKYDREHSLIYCDPPYWGTEGYGVEFGVEGLKAVTRPQVISVKKG